jgi:hypothetical protein
MSLFPRCGEGRENVSEVAVDFSRAQAALAVVRNAFRIAKKESQVARTPVSGDELPSAHQFDSPLDRTDDPNYTINNIK